MGQRDKNGLLEMTLLSIPHKDRIVLFHFKLVIGKPLHVEHVSIVSVPLTRSGMARRRLRWGSER